jgi:translation initiation factor RLI1
MKLEDVEEAINSYFENISPQEVVDKFIEWGYELEDYNSHNEYTINKTNTVVTFPKLTKNIGSFTLKKDECIFRKANQFEVENKNLTKINTLDKNLSNVA